MSILLAGREELKKVRVGSLATGRRWKIRQFKTIVKFYEARKSVILFFHKGYSAQQTNILCNDDSEENAPPPRLPQLLSSAEKVSIVCLLLYGKPQLSPPRTASSAKWILRQK